jgi:hypothetical protein
MPIKDPSFPSEDESPEARKQKTIEATRQVFEEISGELDNPWSRLEELGFEEISEMGLDDREKYEAIKKLQEGDPKLIMDKLDGDIEELRSSISSIRNEYAGIDLPGWAERDVERYSNKLEKLAKLG